MQADHVAYQPRRSTARRATMTGARTPRNPTHAQGLDLILRELGEGRREVAEMRASVDARMEGMQDRIDNRLTSLDTRISRIERDMATGERDRGAAQKEMVEVRRDITDLRDSLDLKVKDLKASTDKSVNSAAVTGAAQGAAQGSAEGAAKAFAPYRGYMAGGGLILGLIGVAEFVDKGEKILRLMFGLFGVKPGAGE